MDGFHGEISLKGQTLRMNCGVIRHRFINVSAWRVLII